jgi:hypothetical protein
METDAARELADRFGEYAQTVWASEVSDVDWNPDLDRIVRTSIQRVLEALVPDGEIGLVKSTEGPLAAALTDDALYVVGLSRITADNVNHSITPVARRIGFDQPTGSSRPAWPSARPAVTCAGRCGASSSRTAHSRPEPKRGRTSAFCDRSPASSAGSSSSQLASGRLTTKDAPPPGALPARTLP